MENQDQPNKTLQDLLTTRGFNGGFGEAKIRRSRDFKFYGITQARTGRNETTMAFKIIQSSLEQLVIPYHDIATPIKFDGKNTIEMSASTLHITIEGQGLEILLDYIIEHRLMWVKEPENSSDTFLSNDDNGEIIITSIDVRVIH